MRKLSRSLISDGDSRKAEGFDAQVVVGEGRGGRRNDARVDEGELTGREYLHVVNPKLMVRGAG